MFSISLLLFEGSPSKFLKNREVKNHHEAVGIENITSGCSGNQTGY